MRLGALALVLLPAVVSAQGDLARRVAQVRDGTVRMIYTSRPDVCGHGERGWRRFRHDHDRDWVADCEFGPVHLRLRVRQGAIVALDTWVGGRWADQPATLDLGRVAAPIAAEYLLTLDVEGAIAAAVLADSTTLWPRLLTIARDANEPEQRRRAAIFWVAQAAGDAATAGLTALVDDGERDIRDAAVFALSQIDGGRAVDVLIRLARTHRDPAVRRSAIFWLGQSRDPRALAYFEDLLRGP